MTSQYTPDWNGSHAEAQERARAALVRQDELRPRGRDRGPHKAEDTSAGRLAMADAPSNRQRQRPYEASA